MTERMTAASASHAQALKRIAELERERDEAHERESATAAVLRIISETPADLQRVATALVESAARLMGTTTAQIFRVSNGLRERVAETGPEVPLRDPSWTPIVPGSLIEQCIQQRQIAAFSGTREELLQTFPGAPADIAEWTGRGATVAVPLMRRQDVIGAFIISRTGEPLDDRELALVVAFADQAVIAMENARLFEELQQLNRQQAEALEREQATAEVLRVISRSPEDLDASLQAVADTAARACGADFARAFLRHGEDVLAGPTSNSGEPEHQQHVSIRVGRLDELGAFAPAEVIRTGRRLHVEDLQARRDSLPADDQARVAQAVQGMDTAVKSARTSLWVPLLRGTLAVGALGLARFEIRPYSDREIALAETFADQAAIAVENARLFQSIKERNSELTEALEQQTATSDVLRIISRSTVELNTVLSALAESAARLCEASDTTFFGIEHETSRIIAYYNFVDSANSGIRPLRRGFLPDRAAIERRPLQIVGDFAQLEEEFPDTLAFTRRHGWVQGAILVVPLLREGEAIGVFRLHRPDPRPFTDKQITLVETFADQAVIAMENARLFDELQTRNREQAEALEREQATAEILRVISRSPESLDVSLLAVAETVTRLCRADNTRVHLREGDYLVFGPSARPPGTGEAWESGERRSITKPRGAATRAAHDGRTVHIADMLVYLQEHGASAQDLEYWSDGISRGASRVHLAVPLLRGGEVVGVLGIGRRENRPFSDREIALAETFADQAAIAVENARLFRSIQERNAELTEALEQQTATSDVLRIISRSPVEIQSVLDSLAESAARLCDATDTTFFGVEAGIVRGLASYNFVSRPILRPLSDGHRTWLPDAAVRERRPIQVAGEFADVLMEYPNTLVRMKQEGWERGALLVVPLLREGQAIGVFRLHRPDPQPFTEKQIALVETFTDQAVIAMENARLFEELQERNHEQAEALEREQATAEVLRVISRSPESLDAALQAVADTASRLCRADIARTWLRDGDSLVAGPGAGRTEMGGTRGSGDRLGPITDGSGYIPIQAVQTGRTVHVEDFVRFLEDRGAARQDAEQLAESVHGSLRTVVAVPMLRGSEAVGVLTFWRQDTVQPFSGREIALAETFADQAAIAVVNARLFKSIQERNAELTEALERERTTGEVLRVISEAPTDLQRVLDTLVANAARLCGGDRARIYRRQEAIVRSEASFNADPDYVLSVLDPPPVSRGSLTGRAILDAMVVTHYGDNDDRLKQFPDAPNPSPVPGARMAVPLLLEGQGVGAFFIVRKNQRPFSDQEIALMRTFADQAVIAMENARLFDELQARTHELEAASGAKSEFLSRMSHELRTPLNAIIGFGEIMEMDQATTPRQRERIHHILGGGRHLLGLINEVLDITRIEAGRLSLSPEPVQLDGVVQEVLDLERPLAAEAKVQLLLDNLDGFHVAVQADRQRLRQIVLNLVANAIKYNRPEGRVTLSCEQPATNFPARAEPVEASSPDRRIRLSVRDTGLGIPADQIGRLFAPFERLSAEGSGVEGTGLGLAIARGLAEAMGGSVGVESVIGEGSVFWVDLPAAIALPGGGLPDPALLVGADADTARHTVATVLYIEDNQPNVDLVQHILDFRPGITLLTAPDGATGVRLARRYRPSLVLLDLNLPDLQGDEVLARLRADDRTNAIPVVMVSADATQGQIDRLLAAGARAYLTKPLDVRRLLAIVDEIAGGGG